VIYTKMCIDILGAEKNPRLSKYKIWGNYRTHDCNVSEIRRWLHIAAVTT